MVGRQRKADLFLFWGVVCLPTILFFDPLESILLFRFDLFLLDLDFDFTPLPLSSSGLGILGSA